MENTPEISIIIPVYNVEKYLERCLDIVLAQTFRDFEIICINDGSPDNSAAILEEYARKDPRVKVITQQNKGQSVARNNGLECAAGKYIYFVDSDDFIHPQLLEIAYHFITKHNADWVSFRHDEQMRQTSKKAAGRQADRAPLVYKDMADIPYKITNNPLYFFGRKDQWKATDYIWARLYKKGLLDGIKFIPGIAHEDTAFIFAVYKKHPKTVLLKEPLYYYDYNPLSIVNTAPKKLLKDMQDNYSALLFVYENYKNADRKEFDFIAGDVVLKYLENQHKAIKKADKSEQPKLYEFFTKELVDFDNKRFIGFQFRRLFSWLQFKKMIRNAKTQ